MKTRLLIIIGIIITSVLVTHQSMSAFKEGYWFMEENGQLFLCENNDSTIYCDNVFVRYFEFAYGIVAIFNIDEAFAIGSSPLERGSIRDIRIKDLENNQITHPLVEYQYQFSTDFSNNQDHSQNFVWIGQIQDENKRTVYLSWLNGTLNAKDGKSTNFSWIPKQAGKYKVTSFMWESLDNPSALTPPLTKEFQVLNAYDGNQISVNGFIVNFKTENTVVEKLWFTEQRNSFDIRVEPNDDAKLEIELPFRMFLPDDIPMADLNFIVLSDDLEIPFTSKTKSSSVIFDIPFNKDTYFIRIVGFF